MLNLKKFAMVLGFVALAGNAFALGLGGYAQFEGGTGNIEFDVDGQTADNDFTSSGWGVGLTLDTAPMTEDLWSYRLDIGYQGLSFDFDTTDDLDPGKVDFTGWVADSTFAFTISSDKVMRIWAGPVIRLGTFQDDEEGGDITYTDIGIGAAVGVNYQVAEKFIISPSLMVAYNYITGDAEFPEGEGDVVKPDVTGSIWTYGLKVNFLYDL